MNLRPMISVTANLVEGYASTRIKSKYRCIGWLITLITLVWTFRPYYEEMIYMIELSIFMLTTISVVLGAFAGPMILESKAKKMGNTVESSDVIGMVVGMVFGAFLAYIVTVNFGGVVSDPLGNYSFAFIGIISGLGISIIVALMLLAFFGEDWAIKLLDVNKDKVVNSKDATAAIGIVADSVKDVFGAVEDAIKK